MWRCCLLFLFINKVDGSTINGTWNKSYIPRNLFLSEPYPFMVFSTTNSRCLHQTERFFRDLNDLQLWAVKMHDSSGKLPSGLLNGNVHAFGDFWQCLSISENLAGAAREGGGVITGKYCQVDVYVEVINEKSVDGRVASILDLVLSHRAIRSTYSDDVKFFPSFTPITWGFCVPDSCTHKDVQDTVSDMLRPYNNTHGLAIRIKSNENSCVSGINISEGGVAFPVICFTWIVVAITLTGTLLEATEISNGSEDRRKNVWFNVLTSFSLTRNWKTLISTDSLKDEISCVHGIRFIFSICIYLLHRGVFGMFVPFSNRTAIAKELEGEWTMIFRAFWNNVDTFVVLSGLLTSYYGVKKLQSGRKLNALLMYARRYYKFTPMYVVTVIIVRNVAGEMRIGPNAIRVTNHFIRTCEHNFWKTFFYVANLDGMNEMCYPPAHQLVTDMQMYLIAPGIILLLWKYSRKGLITVLGMIAALTLYKGLVIYNHNMGSFIYYGASLTEMLVSANQMYLNPLHRLTPYLSGIMLGYFMRTHGHHIKMTQERLNVGWCAAVLSGYYSFFGPKHVSKRTYAFNVAESALFGMAQPVLWSFTLCWVIFVCHSGKGGAVNQLLSWRGFIVFTKLSYAFYLTQILIIFLGISGSNYPEYMRMYEIIDFNEVLLVLAMSIVFTLLFLLPLGELHNLFFEGKVAPTKQPEEKLWSINRHETVEPGNVDLFKGFSTTIS